MKAFPEEYDLVRINLEIDLSDQGGIQRFKTIRDFRTWIEEEEIFWDWMRQQPASQQIDRFSQLRSFFSQCISGSRSQMHSFNQRWQNRKNEYDGFSREQNEQRKSEQIAAVLESFERETEQFKSQVSSLLIQDIVTSKCHIFRGSIRAAFIDKLAKDNPRAAVYALHQLIAESFDSSNCELYETEGRTLAFLFERGWLPKEDGEKLDYFYSETVKTWSRELREYKTEYEGLLGQFEASRQGIGDTLKNWRETTISLQDEFKEQKESNQKDLENLKETYEVHMQLHGARSYWNRKRREHAKMIEVFRLWSIITAALGLPLMLLVAWVLLPTNHPTSTIPWREIGFFMLISTFVLWALRLLVKLLLSHIHLYADAQEREVMISTYMALIRRKESRESLSKDDIAIVLAPIFRPSTTGVINDEGSPVTLTDFISRIAGK